MKETNVKGLFNNRESKRLIFYTVLIAIPSIQFFFFYVYANFNSILLAFQKYSQIPGTTGYVKSFGLFENLSVAWGVIKSSKEMVFNALYLYLFNLVIVSSLALLFSYYIAKKYMWSGLFRVVLFMPTVISQVALVVIYKGIVNDAFCEIIDLLGLQKWATNHNLNDGLLGGNAPNSVKYGVILFYNIWISFGTNVMLYTGAMSSIDQSIVESARLDGVNFFGEFIHIYIPSIWPTFTTFVVTGMTSIFTTTMHLTTFYGTTLQTPFNVFGYFLYKQTTEADFIAKSSKFYSFGELSAIGLIITLVMVPLTLFVRKLMETYGPRTDK